MEDCLKLTTTKEVIKKILSEHDGRNYFQCGKCCSIKSDAKELAHTLYVIVQALKDSKGDFVEEVGEECNALLYQIIVIGMPEECYSDSEFCTKWVRENNERYLPELDDYIEGDAYIKSRDIILKVDDGCECLMIPLTKER